MSDGINIARANFTLKVLDVNEHAPVFTRPFVELELPANDVPIGTVLTRFVATDADGIATNEAEQKQREEEEKRSMKNDGGIAYEFVMMRNDESRNEQQKEHYNKPWEWFDLDRNTGECVGQTIIGW